MTSVLETQEVWERGGGVSARIAMPPAAAPKQQWSGNRVWGTAGGFRGPRLRTVWRQHSNALRVIPIQRLVQLTGLGAIAPKTQT